jgi:hypothetical protein
MRILLGAFLLAAAAAWAVPDEGQEREIAAAKERLHAMLDEAALLEQGGHREEAARLRAEADALKEKIMQAKARLGGRDAPREPREEALHNLEKAIGALEKAGYEGMAKELRGMADRLGAEIKRVGLVETDEGFRRNLRAKARGEDADFWHRNMDTLRIALKGLAEAERRDAADLVERAIHARKLKLEGRKDDEAREIMRNAPDDAQLAELLLMAAGCWREFKQPEQAAQCEELGRFFQQRALKEQEAPPPKRGDPEARRREGREGPGPERVQQIEARLDRIEEMLHDLVQRLEERERGGR